MKDTLFAPEVKETLPPIFSLTLSFTNSQLTIDANQLNTLRAACAECELSVDAHLNEIQKELQNAYQKVTTLFEDILLSMYSKDAIIKSKVESVSNSTIFFIGGDDEHD